MTKEKKYSMRKNTEILLTKCVDKYFLDNVEHYTHKGLQYIKDKKIIIVGIARDIAERLPNFQETIDHILKLKPKELKVFIYENDSTDNTQQLLIDWKKEQDQVFNFTSEKRNAPDLRLSVSDDRTNNLAYARNQCLNYVKRNAADFDYVIVLDTDMNDYSTSGLLNSFGYLCEREDIDAMAGFSYLLKKLYYEGKPIASEPVYTNYDCWAYRHTDWYDTYSTGTMYWFWHWIPLIGSNPWKVLSAFGGSCIYKTKDYFLDD